MTEGTSGHGFPGTPHTRRDLLRMTGAFALGAALAQSGQKVAMIDFDVGLRNLDLIMGCERRVVSMSSRNTTTS